MWTPPRCSAWRNARPREHGPTPGPGFTRSSRRNHSDGDFVAPVAKGTLVNKCWPTPESNGALGVRRRLAKKTKPPVNREKEIFDQALDLASAEERVAFLKGACGANAVLL